MEYTVENLEKVVTLFYKSEAVQQAEAHQWLTEAQNSPQAWSFVWELLDPQRVRYLVSFYYNVVYLLYALRARRSSFSQQQLYTQNY